MHLSPLTRLTKLNKTITDCQNTVLAMDRCEGTANAAPMIERKRVLEDWAEAKAEREALEFYIGGNKK
jgi:hypothetical protein